MTWHHQQVQLGTGKADSKKAGRRRVYSVRFCKAGQARWAALKTKPAAVSLGFDVVAHNRNLQRSGLQEA